MRLPGIPIDCPPPVALAAATDHLRPPGISDPRWEPKQSIEEFALPAIQALSLSKKMTGERIQVAHSGTTAEIINLGHGQGDAIVRAFHAARRTTDSPATASDGVTATATAVDPVEQLQRLAALRDQGILTPEEFESKKAAILARL